jgi:dephospho-CoA kinase
MRLIGITGGVATGKSLVARLFEQQGAVALSADAIAREVTAPDSPAVHRIAAELGRRFVHDGVLDRAGLGEHVFACPEDRRKLERIVHPEVLRRLRDAIDDLRNREHPPEVVVVEVPLLYEVGLENWFDEVVVVTASEKEQIRRLAVRDGLDAEAARGRIEAQMPLGAKAARAHHVIINDGSEDTLMPQVQAILGNRSV